MCKVCLSPATGLSTTEWMREMSTHIPPAVYQLGSGYAAVAHDYEDTVALPCDGCERQAMLASNGGPATQSG